MTWPFSRCLFDNVYVMWVEHLSKHWAICDCSLSDFKIISSLLIWPFFCKKRFYHAPKSFICNNTIFENILKIFLNFFLTKRHTFVSLCLALFSFSLVGFLQKLFLNLLLVYIAFFSSLFIKGAWHLFFKGAWYLTTLMKLSAMKWFSSGSFVDKSKFVSLRYFLKFL